MENFAAIVRSLLTRIRSLPTSGPRDPKPPVAPAVECPPLYRVAPTAWGVDPDGNVYIDKIPAAATIARAAMPRRRRRRRLETAVFSLPVPRGLPAT